MKRITPILIFLAICVILPVQPVAAQTNMIGYIAPTPILVTLEGQYQYLSKLYYAGAAKPREPRSIVALNFMGLKCPPCRKELPLFLEVMRSACESKKVKEIGVSIRYFVISTDPLSAKEELRKFLADQNVEVNTEVLLDPYKKAAGKFGVKGIPRTFVISPKGRITADITGATDDYRMALRKGIAAAIKGFDKDE